MSCDTRIWSCRVDTLAGCGVTLNNGPGEQKRSVYKVAFPLCVCCIASDSQQ